MDTVYSPNLIHYAPYGEYGVCLSTFDNLPDITVNSLEESLRMCEERTGHRYSDIQVVAFLNAFVRIGIGYAYDIDQYGIKDYVASPLETLYLGKGDCEDVAILHYALCNAFGYEAVVLTMENHVKSGVLVDSWLPKTSDGYVIFECTSARYLPISYAEWQGAETEIEGVFSSDQTTFSRFEKMLILYGQNLGWFYPNLFG